MDANLVNPFIEATLNILETTASTQAVSGKPYLKKDQMARGDITGLIRLSGQEKGTVSISFSKSGILDIVSNMFGEPLDELNDDIKDAVGEIANMISGQVTNTIVQNGMDCKASLETVILEENHVIPHIGMFPAVAIPFETKSGEFTIEVCFEN